MDFLSQGLPETVTAQAGPAAAAVTADAALGAERGTATAEAATGRRRLAALLRRPTFVLSALVVAWWVGAASWHLFGLDPYANTGKLLASPGWSQPFGTDNLGRSVFARTMAGGDTALVVGPLGAVLATVLGSALGVGLAGEARYGSLKHRDKPAVLSQVWLRMPSVAVVRKAVA